MQVVLIPGILYLICRNVGNKTNVHNRCGANLVKLYELPITQHFLNSIPLKETQNYKAIYQPGYLRKVCIMIKLKR